MEGEGGEEGRCAREGWVRHGLQWRRSTSRCRVRTATIPCVMPHESSKRLRRTAIGTLLEDGVEEGEEEGRAPKPCKTLKRGSVDQIGYAAGPARSRDPVRYDNQRMAHVPADGRINASNPCSEYMFLETRHATWHRSISYDSTNDGNGMFAIREISACDASCGRLCSNSPFSWRSFQAKENCPQELRVPHARTSGTRILAPCLCVWAFRTIRRKGGPSPLRLRQSLRRGLRDLPRKWRANSGHSRHLRTTETVCSVSFRNHRRAVYSAPARGVEGAACHSGGIDQNVCPAPLLSVAKECWIGRWWTARNMGTETRGHRYRTDGYHWSFLDGL